MRRSRFPIYLALLLLAAWLGLVTYVQYQEMTVLEMHDKIMHLLVGGVLEQ